MATPGLPEPGAARIECVRGDITREEVDVIVNAANESLRGGGGVDGAIHRAAGPGLLAECRARYPAGCPAGEVRLTGGHALPARAVLHAVGPIWRGGGAGEAERLASCYRSAVQIAAREDLPTMAFPAISCGVYGYPAPGAARVALSALAGALRENAEVRAVRMVLFSEELLAVFSQELERIRG